jgi:hypothetical protein
MKQVIQVELWHPVYNREVRLRLWNGRTSARRCQDFRTAAKLIARHATQWTKDEHSAIAHYHSQRCEKLKSVWIKVAERAAMDLFGRPWEFSDYQVCAVGRSEFSERHKRVLRHCAYRSAEHAHIAMAHAQLAERTKC